MATQIQVKRSENNPHKAAQASLDALPPAEMHMEADKPNRAIKSPKLCLLIGGNQFELNLKDKAYKGIKPKLLNQIWEDLKKFLPKGATEPRIDYTNLTVRYRDNAGNYQHQDLRNITDAEFMKLAGKVRTMMKQVFKGMGFIPDLGGNRPKNGPRPFEICSNKWHKQMQVPSMNQFIKKGHMQTLADYLESQKQNPNAAFSRITAAEEFLQNFQRDVGRTRAHLEGQIKDPNFKTHPKTVREETLKALKDVKELEEDLMAVDRFALYWAMGMWGDRDPSNLTKEERFKLANEISLGVERTLTHELQPGKDDRWFPSFRNSQEGQDLRKLEPAIASYAMDVGDVVIPDHLGRIERADDLGVMVKRPSLVEFVAHHAMHLQDPNFDQTAAIDSLGYRLPKELSEHLGKICKDASKEALETQRAAESAVKYRTAPWGKIQPHLDDRLKKLIGD